MDAIRQLERHQDCIRKLQSVSRMLSSQGYPSEQRSGLPRDKINPTLEESIDRLRKSGMLEKVSRIPTSHSQQLSELAVLASGISTIRRNIGVSIIKPGGVEKLRKKLLEISRRSVNVSATNRLSHKELSLLTCFAESIRSCQNSLNAKIDDPRFTDKLRTALKQRNNSPRFLPQFTQYQSDLLKLQGMFRSIRVLNPRPGVNVVESLTQSLRPRGTLFDLQNQIQDRSYSQLIGIDEFKMNEMLRITNQRKLTDHSSKLLNIDLTSIRGDNGLNSIVAILHQSDICKIIQKHSTESVQTSNFAFHEVFNNSPEAHGTKSNFNEITEDFNEIIRTARAVSNNSQSISVNPNLLRFVSSLSALTNNVTR